MSFENCSIADAGFAAGRQRSDVHRHLTPQEASDYLKRIFGIRRSPKTLAKLRCVSSSGPVFVRAGRSILYPTDGLDTYADAITSAPMRSTSDKSSSRSNVSNNLAA